MRPLGTTRPIMRLKKHLPFLILLAGAAFVSPGLRAETGAHAEFDEAPAPVKSVAPEYPAEMKRLGAAGLVTVKVSIDENGDVVERAVAKSSRPEFESAALDAVAKWKFKPARKAGVAVKCHVNVPIKFSADES